MMSSNRYIQTVLPQKTFFLSKFQLLVLGISPLVFATRASCSIHKSWTGLRRKISTKQNSQSGKWGTIKNQHKPNRQMIFFLNKLFFRFPFAEIQLHHIFTVSPVRTISLFPKFILSHHGIESVYTRHSYRLFIHILGTIGNVD